MSKGGWVAVAHKVNGYELAGSFEACAEISKKVERQLDEGVAVEFIDTNDLRIALFLAARAAHHQGDGLGDDTRERMIAAELEDRESRGTL